MKIRARSSNLLTIFLVLTVALIVSLWTIYWVHARSRALYDTLIDDRWALQRLDDLVSSLKDAETGQRGYIITGEGNFLEPYHASSTAIQRILLDLADLARRGDLPMDGIRRIHQLALTKMRFLEESIQARRDRGFTAAQSIVLTGDSKRTMDLVRAQAAALKRPKQQEVDRTLRRIERIKQSKTTLWGAVVLLNFTVLALAFRRLSMEIRARQDATDDEARQRELVTVTLASIGDGVIVTDRHGQVRFMNPEAERLTGWSALEATDQPLNLVFNIMSESTRKRVENPLEKVLRQGTVIGLANHTVLISRTGQLVPIDDCGATIQLKGEVHGVVLVFRDVTLRKHAERNLALAKESAERASEAKSNFLANMSHELRTPLAAITGFAELLLDPTISHEERRTFGAKIQRNSRHLTQLIEDILDLARVEARKLTTELSRCSFPDLLTEVIARHAETAREKGLFFRLTSSSPVPAIIASDPVRLKRILDNVLDNALKFTDAGGIELRIQPTEADPEGASVLKILIRDTGQGVPLDQQEQIFTPFTQADSSSTRKFGGTGLGLALSKRLAQSLGGDLKLVASEPGRGSTFEVSIKTPLVEGSQPLRVSPQRVAQIGDGSVTRMPTDRRSLSGIRVLIVDDAPDNQLLFKQLLRSKGANVELAENGAVGVAKALSQDYDIVLMDLLMPVRDGFEATAELRRHDFDRPILAVSAAALRSERERALQAGCNEHLTKPINPKELIQKILIYTSPQQSPAFS